MFRTYHLKWCFTMIGILGIGTLLMKPGNISSINWGQYMVHSVSITSNILISWMILAYTKKLHLPRYSAYTKAFISIGGALTGGMILNTVLAYLIPARLFFPENHMGFGYADVLKRLIGTFFMSLACYIVYNNLETNEKFQQTKLENEQFKQAHLRAQLLSLQQQISPHFLFNSLSTLKTIATDGDTKNFVVQLSHVYRYLLSFNERQVSRLSEELTFIRSYLYILHQRFENALKHNAVSADQPLTLSIFIDENEELVVKNNYQPKKVPPESTGLGLQNINDRFRLLFNKEIRIEHTTDNFTVTLPLTSYEHYYH